ncbi:low molecular weight phosphotyrosine protein phosphatase [Billgrantia azerbaijanica]|nr:low molecular weight phosphotyrosine protein phosphatase [Halomonas azerbaijanica]
MFEAILVVCRGNICRSPVAAAMLAQHLPGRRIQSAGLTALVGYPADPRSSELALADGLDLGRHRAQQVGALLLGEADLVLVMSDSQRLELARRWPGALGKTLHIGHWLEEKSKQDIPDPFGRSQETYRHVHQVLRAATNAWVARL